MIVSQSPDLIVYTKDDQDNILKKEMLLTGWRGIDHDHGLHAIVFGPDGRLYFNNGDQGLDGTDKSGKRILSSRGGFYFAGTALRMNPDGSDLTVIGHNFRNPYELALDSFGNVWQTDNDDDGNAWVRLNYVMEGGNFGYWGPGGRSWEVDKGTHFHAELPGIIPNVLRMGATASLTPSEVASIACPRLVTRREQSLLILKHQRVSKKHLLLRLNPCAIWRL